MQPPESEVRLARSPGGFGRRLRGRCPNRAERPPCQLVPAAPLAGPARTAARPATTTPLISYYNGLPRPLAEEALRRGGRGESTAVWSTPWPLVAWGRTYPPNSSCARTTSSSGRLHAAARTATPGHHPRRDSRLSLRRARPPPGTQRSSRRLPRLTGSGRSGSQRSGHLPQQPKHFRVESLGNLRRGRIVVRRQLTGDRVVRRPGAATRHLLDEDGDRRVRAGRRPHGGPSCPW